MKFYKDPGFYLFLFVALLWCATVLAFAALIAETFLT